MPSAQEIFDLATDIEKMVYVWLVSNHIPFEFQSQLIGGFDRQTGDATVDFYLPENQLVFRCQGEYWHTGAEVQAKDAFQRASLEGLGYKVIDLYEDDIKGRLAETMKLAMIGEEQPHG